MKASLKLETGEVNKFLAAAENPANKAGTKFLMKSTTLKIAFLIPSKAFPIKSVKLKLLKKSAAESKPILSSIKLNAPLIASSRPPTKNEKKPLKNPTAPANIFDTIPPS